MSFVSEKVMSLPPYLFSEFQAKKKKLQEEGMDVIDLGIGAPDLAAPPFVYEKLIEEAKYPANHRYSTYSGCDEFKEAVASFYKKQYNVRLDPETEVLALIGSKEGIANLVQAVINPGDSVLIPDPGYPVYRNAVHLAGGEGIHFPLKKENGFLPQFEKISSKDAEKSKLLFLNYPSNPTTATANSLVFLEAITFAEKYKLLVVNDAAYDLITFGDYRSPSILQAPNAKKFAVEFGSLSKSFNMTGWRIGYVVGNKEVIQALATLKSNIDTCQFIPIQKAAVEALRSDFSTVAANNNVYEKRMEKLQPVLNELGLHTEKPKGTIFLWAQVPEGYTSMKFADQMLEELGIILTPGTAFGPSGEGFVRIALTVDESRLEEVILRLKEWKEKGASKA
ncbi:aminotransferase class I/II-fold pyridoxal phosphate-dependent enzyme [Virgibacillus halodenitrificans]|uniref:aminotransferase class I/II-fold pyridoxal phosphate-dependent enzyme n=1 Tax=Virgibacillus halodenitrificans TaxID=1482 RepID=UPI001F39D69C|nr:aminotransferase class I/II-fold pyridoxal phosphate-dependent enzyme [Virgibacillus halodenitrificans]